MFVAFWPRGAASPTPGGGVLSTASGVGPRTSAPASRLFRPPLSARLLSLFGTMILAFVTAMMTVFAVLAFSMQWALGLFMTALAIFIGGLTGYVWRDLSGKWTYSIRLGPTAAELDLPAGRSLIHRPPNQHFTIPYADIKSVETRLEAYGNFGMEMMQRAYVLRSGNDDLIFLFEDRALGTGLENQLFADFASDLAARAGVAVRDLGMVEGKNGFLGMWGTHAPDWAAPSLTLAQQLRLWRRAAFTGTLTGAAILLALAIRVLFGG
jgi:hypothetical protein